MENKQQIQGLIDRWGKGNRRTFASDVKASIDRVHKWYSNGRIPAECQHAVVVAAQKRGFRDITADWMIAAHAPAESKTLKGQSEIASGAVQPQEPAA